MPKKRGFTLIELLVVIAIIALLLAILMPALKSAKSRAIKLYSMSNMRSLALAWNVYTHSNNSKIVGGMVWRNQNRQTGNYDIGVNGIRPFDWVQPLDMASTAPTGHEKELEGIRKGALWPYIENTKAYHSPGNRAWKKTVTYNSERSPYRSYTISDAMNGMWRPNYSYRSLGSIRTPGDRMVFTEENDLTNWGSWILGPSGTNKWHDPLVAWYGKGTISIFGFADGHAEQRIWQERSTIKWIEGTENGSNFNIGDEIQDFRFIVRAFHHKYEMAN